MEHIRNTAQVVAGEALVPLAVMAVALLVVLVALERPTALQTHPPLGRVVAVLTAGAAAAAADTCMQQMPTCQQAA